MAPRPPPPPGSATDSSHCDSLVAVSFSMANCPTWNCKIKSILIKTIIVFLTEILNLRRFETK